MAMAEQHRVVLFPMVKLLLWAFLEMVERPWSLLKRNLCSFVLDKAIEGFEGEGESVCWVLVFSGG